VIFPRTRSIEARTRNAENETSLSLKSTFFNHYDKELVKEIKQIIWNGVVKT